MKDKIIDELKGKAVLIIVGIVLVVANQIWSYIQKGAEADVNAKIESVVFKSLQKDEIVSQLMTNPRLVKMILESEAVKEFTDKAGQDIHDKIVENVTKSDSNKVSMRSFVGTQAGIRDEQVLPVISEIVKAWNEGKITTKEELEKYVDREIKTARF